MTSASQPSPALKLNHRSSARPSPTLRERPSAIAPSRVWVASSGSRGTPRARAKTFADPPGTTPSAGTWSPGPSASSPLRASLTVPSPPSTTTRSTASAPRPGGELGGVAPVPGDDDVELDLARERVRDDVLTGRRRRGGRGIGHEQRTHGPHRRPGAPPVRGVPGKDVADLSTGRWATHPRQSEADPVTTPRPVRLAALGVLAEGVVGAGRGGADGGRGPDLLGLGLPGPARGGHHGGRGRAAARCARAPAARRSSCSCSTLGCAFYAAVPSGRPDWGVPVLLLAAAVLAALISRPRAGVGGDPSTGPRAAAAARRGRRGR